MKWVDSYIDHKGRSITEIKDINEKEFQWADGTLETLFIDENPYILSPIITRQQWMELPEAVQEEYRLDTWKGDLLIYKLKSDLPTKTTIKRPHERIKRVSGVAKGIMNLGVTRKPRVENKAHKVDPKGKTLWHLPSYTVYLTTSESKNLKKANKYLQHMQGRIGKAISKKEFKYAAWLGLILIQRSKVFTLYVLTRTCKGYFWKLPEMDIWSNLNKYVTFVRDMSYQTTVKRFYVAKPGGKFRPIGAPNLWSKMVFKALEIIMRELLEDRIGKYQHGFIRERGCQTATMALIERLRENPKAKVYEFDLKSFFNKVNPIRVCDSIERDFGPIGDWLRAITLGSLPRIPIKRLKPEMELIYGFFPEDRKRQIIHKYGFTQGSPLSPLMCNYALELAGLKEIEGLIMYADDGIIVTDKEIKLDRILSKYIVKLSGIRLALDKPWGETRRFKFLGLEYDLDDRSITRQEERVKLDTGWTTRSKSMNNPMTEKIVSHRIDIDDATADELKGIIQYTSYGQTDSNAGNQGGIGMITNRKVEDQRVFSANSMVSKTSWLSFHVNRIRDKYKTGLEGEIGTLIGGLRNWLRTLDSAPKGEGWNDAWTSTVIAVVMLDKIEMRGGIRKIDRYELPAKFRNFSGIVEGFRKYRYDTIDHEILEEYWDKFNESGQGAWGETLNFTDDDWMWIEDSRIAQEEEMIRQDPENRIKPIIKRYLD